MYIGSIETVRTNLSSTKRIRGGHRWRCNCGTTNLFTSSDSRQLAEADLDAHIRKHMQNDLVIARTEDDTGVPDAPPNVQRTDDVRQVHPTRPDASQDPRDARPLSLDDALAHRTRKARWRLFNTEELIALNQALVVVGTQVLGNSVLLRETQEEMNRRNIPMA